MYVWQHLLVNPSCPKAFASLAAPAGQETGPAQALAGIHSAGLAELAELAKPHPFGPPTDYREIAGKALLHLESYEWEAVMELKGRSSGSAEVERYLAQQGLCHCCLNTSRPLAKCRRPLCSLMLCRGCLTKEGNCYCPDFCRHLPSRWRAAIRVLQDSDHPIARKWREAAGIATTCLRRIGWGSLPRRDDNR